MSSRSYRGGLGGGLLRPNTRSGRRLFQDGTTSSTSPTDLPLLQNTPSSHPNPSTHSTLPTHPTPSVPSNPSIHSTHVANSLHLTPSTQVAPSTHLTPSIDSNASSDPLSNDALSQTSTTSAAKKKNGRGPTTKTVIDIRKPGDPRVKVKFWNGKALTQVYVTSIGVWVRTYSTFPPNIKCFEDATREAKEKLYSLIADNFEFEEAYEELNGESGLSHESVHTASYVPNDPNSDPILIIPASPIIRNVIKHDCRDAFYRHMKDLRKKYFNPFQTNEERLQNVPYLMHPNHWSFLVEYWSTPTYKQMSEINSANGAKNVMPHTLGSRPIALVRKKSLEEKGHIDEVDIFDATHINKKGKFTSDEAASASSRMNELKTQHTNTDGSCSLTSHQILIEVRGNDWKGRKRGHGGQFIEAPKCTNQTNAELVAKLREELEDKLREELEDKLRAELEDKLRAEIKSEATIAAEKSFAKLVASLPQHFRDKITHPEQRNAEDEP